MVVDIFLFAIVGISIIILAFLVYLMYKEATNKEWVKISTGVRNARNSNEEKK